MSRPLATPWDVPCVPSPSAPRMAAGHGPYTYRWARRVAWLSSQREVADLCVWLWLGRLDEMRMRERFHSERLADLEAEKAIDYARATGDES